MAKDNSAHCLLGFPQWRHFKLAYCWNKLTNLSVGPASIMNFNIIYYRT